MCSIDSCPYCASPCTAVWPGTKVPTTLNGCPRPGHEGHRGGQGTDRQAASTNAMSRFETEVLTEEENLEGLACLNVERVAQEALNEVVETVGRNNRYGLPQQFAAGL